MFKQEAVENKERPQEKKKPTPVQEEQKKTGNPELDAMLQAMKEEYHAICRVHLDSDDAERILLPAHWGYGEKEEQFSVLFTKYVAEAVEPDYRRGVQSFLNYDNIKNQLNEGVTPKITYKKSGDRDTILRVYQIGDSVDDTLWVFAKA